MTDPLVSADVDCTDLDGFMLNVERLMASELVALSSHEVIGAALLLWCRAWKQRPAASLPNDDKVIAAFARMPLPRFRKLRDEVLRGFVLCSDGRLYHATLAREAVNAYERKVAFQRKRDADAERLRTWRSGKRDETQKETQGETRFVAEGQGQGQGQGHEIPPTPGKPGRDGVHEFPPGFEALWALYPRKVAKAAAAKAFARLRPDEALQARIAAAVRAQAESPDWRKDRGAFVPHLATWLNGRRWEDDTSAGTAGDIFAGAV